MPIQFTMNTTYTVDEEVMPYFKAWLSFKTSQVGTTETDQEQEIFDHTPNQLFPVAVRAVSVGYHTVFEDPVMGTDLQNYQKLCETLDLLCVDVLKGARLSDLTTTVRREEWSKSFGAAFQLVYCMLTGRVEMESPHTPNIVYGCVSFVISHSDKYTLVLRRVMESAYHTRFVATKKQAAALDACRDRRKVPQSSKNVVTGFSPFVNWK